MNDGPKGLKVAILDDFQDAASGGADWSAVAAKAEISIFNDHIDDRDSLVARLAPFDVVCVMRERTPLPASVLELLPNLKLIVSTGPTNASIDVGSARTRGIEVRNTGYLPRPAIELAWALISASARNVVEEAVSLRGGGWQTTVGVGLAGKTLGILGLGRIGTEIARIARAFDMEVIAWSPNLTEERAQAAQVELVSRNALFSEADFLTVHLVLSDATRGIVGRLELALMKPTARLINTSRGLLVDEGALVAALRKQEIAGAAIDVFDEEPLPQGHPFRSLPGLLATPHIGYVSEEQYALFYGDMARAISDWIESRRDLR